MNLDPTDAEIAEARAMLEDALVPFAYGAPSHVAATVTLGSVRGALDFAAEADRINDTAIAIRRARAAITAYRQWDDEHIAALHAKREGARP